MPLKLRIALSLALSSFLLVAPACNDSNDGGPSVAARVPDGSGRVTIQMIGTWEVRGVDVVESGGPAPAPAPVNGTQFVISADGIASIGGFSVTRDSLEAALGFPLDSYVNQVDGRTVLYGVTSDRLAQGGRREVVGLAGGSVDDSTISVEQFNSNQVSSSDPESFIRVRYSLVRIGTSIFIPQEEKPLADGERGPSLTDLMRERFAREVPADGVK